MRSSSQPVRCRCWGFRGPLAIFARILAAIHGRCVIGEGCGQSLSGVSCTRRERTFMATHKAYVDDSGSAEDPSHSACSIAGFVGTADQWAEFEREWAIQLANFFIPYLHMREFAHHLPAFDQLKDDERKDALRALIQTINQCNLFGFGAASLARRGLLECKKMSGPEVCKKWVRSAILPAVASARRLPIFKRKNGLE